MIKKYYGYYQSPIGTAKIVCSDSAVISVTLVDNVDNFGEKNQVVDDVIKQLDEYFQGKRRTFDLEIHMEGTDFQKKVWKKLLNIPFGSTMSYKELAVLVGSEKAVRAVGNANSKNKLWIIVPCHRVIGSNGKLTGYAGGLDRKAWLLEHEKAVR